jgi:DNA-binding FadR family transcriptional regulator
MPNKIASEKESGPHDRNGGTDLLFSYLRERILSGALTVGSSLPSERDLAVQLGVSRPVLREALRALAMIGVVEIRHGAGTLLRRPDASALGQFFAFSMMYDVPLAEDITEARIAVECQTGRLAIKRATAGDFEVLEAALERIDATIDDPESGAEADYAFHCALVAAAHAPVLSTLYLALTEFLHSTHLYRRRSIQLTEDFKAYIVDDHRRILGTLASGDEDRIDMVLRHHFSIGNEFREQAVRQEVLQRMQSRTPTVSGEGHPVLSGENSNP